MCRISVGFKVAVDQAITKRDEDHSIMAHPDSLELRLFLAAIPFYIIGFKTRQMHTTTNYLLANLSACDLITILLAPLYFFSYLLGYHDDQIRKMWQIT